MTLGALIERLSDLSPTAHIALDDGALPCGFSSYRGYYDHLALTYRPDDGRSCTVAELLNQARAANGETFHGWKGGEYVMSDRTPVWVDNPGDFSSRALVAVEPCGDEYVIHTAYIGEYA